MEQKPILSLEQHPETGEYSLKMENIDYVLAINIIAKIAENTANNLANFLKELDNHFNQLEGEKQ